MDVVPTIDRRSSVSTTTLCEAEGDHQHVDSFPIRRQRQDEGLELDDPAIDDLTFAEIAARLPTLDDAGEVAAHACAIDRIGVLVDELAGHIVAEKPRAIGAVDAIAEAQRIAAHLDKIEPADNIFEIDDVEARARRKGGPAPTVLPVLMY